MHSAAINKVIAFSSVDGPGNRTAVFLQGCGYKCKYCHNPETIRECVSCGECVKVCKSGALSYIDGKIQYDANKCVSCDECIHTCKNLSSPKTKVCTVDEVMGMVQKNMPFIRGITVSGGECTGQRDFLLELLARAKEKNLGTLIDSNGSFLFENDKELLEVTDGVMLDVKAWDSFEHKELTGQDNRNVKANLSFLLSVNKLEEVRLVVVPELVNCKETVEMICAELLLYKRADTRFKIIKYRVNGVRNEFKNIKPPTDDFLNELKAYAEGQGLTNVIIT